MPISTTIKTIQDIMRKDAGVDGDAQRISQLGWMIFLKVFDDREVEKELLDERYKSPVPERLRWRAWAKDSEGITGETLLDFVNNDLFKTLKELPPSGKHAAVAGVVRGVFEDAYNYMKSGTLMRQVINKLNEIDFNRAADRHEFGDIYEKILADLQSAGNAGEYYTPRAVTQLIVDQIDPKLGEKVLDPACGTGGFLTCTIEHVRNKYVKSAEHEALLQASVFGVEKKPLPHLLCVTNMIFHGIEVPSNIRHDNTLTRPLRDYGPKDRVDVIVTNPPFGGMEEDGIENNFPEKYRTRETADLFLLLLLTLLKPGGRAALVLPDGTLFGEGVKTKLKEKLLEECNLHTILRLPKGVFNPYTPKKTNLLFFEKGTPTKAVWYYDHPYPPGYKSYSKTKPLGIEEFGPERNWWGKRKETDQAWKVSIEDIKARGYNLDIKNPRAVDDGPGDADELLRQHRDAKAEAAKARDALREELRVALVDGPDAVATAWKRVAENFEVIFGRVESVASLRRSILALACNGELLGGGPVACASGSAGPRPLPQGWVSRTMGTVASRISNGLATQQTKASTPFRVTRIETIATGQIDLNRTGFIPVCDADQVAKYRLLAGDILFSHINSVPHLGKTALVQPEHEAAGLLHGTNLILIRPDHRIIHPEYLNLVLRHHRSTGRTARDAQHAVQQASINQGVIRGLEVPLPALPEQRRIVAKVEHLMKLCDDLEAKLQRADETAAKVGEALVAELVAA